MNNAERRNRYQSLNQRSLVEEAWQNTVAERSGERGEEAQEVAGWRKNAEVPLH